MEEIATWSPGRTDTVVAALARAVAAWGDEPFLEFSGTRYTYRQFDHLSNAQAHVLADLGVRPGQTVVTMLDNNIDSVVLWYAVNKLSAVWVPVNTAYKGEFLSHVIADAASAIVVCEHDYAPRLAAIAGTLPNVRIILHRNTLEVPLDCAIPIRPLDAYRGTNSAPITAAPPAPGDLAMLIFTGGTTGPSKGCMISHNYCCNQAYQTIECSNRTRAEVHFTPLPLFHFNSVSTAVVASSLIGAQVSIAPRFSVSNFWPEIERTGAAIASILGSMPAMLAKAPDSAAMKRCFGRLRLVRGAPFPPDIQQVFATRFGVKSVGSNVFGLTEASMLTTLSVDEVAKPGSSGKRNAQFDVRIVDDEGRELPAGIAGEIIVRPRQPDIMFAGYWGRPADTLRIMKDLWLHTGDIGKFDEDGYFYFVDRKKDYLRRRGENISSFEVENTFRQHPAVADVAVHAVPSEVGEDDLKVTCVIRAGHAVTEEALCHWSIDRIPYFAVPRYIEFRDELPRSPVGRVLKHQLRAEGKTAATWDREATDFQLVKR
jgi:crotonobetaine/carnitine-CoA ligase